MLPTITQRTLMLIAIVAGSLAWLAIKLPLTAADGSSGLSLMDARIGLVLACLLLLLAGLPALLTGLYVSASGNPLSGIFTVGFALMILAGQGGSMTGLIRRQSSGGDIFLDLQIELALWALAGGGLMFLIAHYRKWIRSDLVPHRLQTPFSKKLTEEDTPRFVLHVAPIVAGMICSALAYIGCRYLITSPDTGQVIGALLLVFTASAFAAREFVPTGNVVFLILSPLAVAVIGYAHMSILHGTASEHDLIGLWQTGQITGPAQALPIHFASAGIVGVTLGIGLAQAIDRVRFAEQVISEKTQAEPSQESAATVSDSGKPAAVSEQATEPIELAGVDLDEPEVKPSDDEDNAAAESKATN